MYIYIDLNSKYSVAQTERHFQKQAVAFCSPVWQSSDYAVQCLKDNMFCIEVSGKIGGYSVARKKLLKDK